MTEEELGTLLKVLLSTSTETEWIEFKENNENPEEIGEYLSALSNTATLHNKEAAYLVWGVQDKTHDIIGTTFQPRKHKVGDPNKNSNQELESWLSRFLSPNIDFRFHEFKIDRNAIVILEIQPCHHAPVRWKDIAYIRIGSYKKKLKDFPEKERTLWLLTSRTTFEKGIALRDVSPSEVLQLIDYPAYFDLTKQPLPSMSTGILERLTSEEIIAHRINGNYDISNLGAILFAKRLSNFDILKRKAIRIIRYTGINRVTGGREQAFDQGYAVGFDRIISYINSQLPSNEHIEQALRVETTMYPPIAIRELVANAIIHQDLTSTGTSPMVEIFTDRIEITNPGKPLIKPLRFADAIPKSRNELIAGFMRRIGYCEERGSGIDKVLAAVEMFQLPAPDFAEAEEHTRVYLYSPRLFSEMSGQERVRACYWHACLLYVSGQRMSNETLRKRLNLDDSKHNQVGRIIADARDAGLIKPADPENKSPRYARYVPFWA